MDQRIIDLHHDYVHDHSDRRKFLAQAARIVGSAGAAAALLPVLDCNFANAQTIAEDDPRITTERVSFEGVTGTVNANLVLPSTPGPHPGVVVVHEAGGINPHQEDIARRLAIAGFAALGVDFLSPAGGVPGPGEGSAFERLRTLNPEETVQNGVAGVAYLRSRPETSDKIGAVGFCWGGRVTQALAVNDPSLNAVVVFYGQPPHPSLAPRLNAPLLMNYADVMLDMDDAKVGPMVDHLVGCNAYLEPDLMAASRGFHVNWARVQQEDATFYSDPELMAYYPKTPAMGVLENVKDPSTYLSADALDVRARGFANQMIFLKRFVDAGGKIVAASDTPQSPPGLGMHQEVTAFVEDAGLTPMQAIQSGTLWVAEALHLTEDLGTVEEGKLADLLIVNADPLENILNLREIETVFKDGQIVDRNYHADYQGWLFSNNRVTDNRNQIESGDWVRALKDATWRPNARNGGWGNTGGIDSNIAPTPGIESLVPHTVLRGSPEAEITITGFSFVSGSQVLVDGNAIPTEVVSRTEIIATIPANILSSAGNLNIVVRNPEPVRQPYWGDSSNIAHILVPFEYTNILPNEGW